MSEAIAYPPPSKPLKYRIIDMQPGDTFAVDTTIGSLKTTVTAVRKLYPDRDLAAAIDTDGKPRVWWRT